MIKIFDKDVVFDTEDKINTLGLGTLDDILSIIVVEELNGEYELEMEYPISGKNFDKIELRNIIVSKSNIYDTEQPFRIYNITKPIDGVVTIKAEHISYDTSGITILPKRDIETNDIISYGVEVVDPEDAEKVGYYLDSIFNDINNSSILGIEATRFTLKRHSSKNNVFRNDGYFIESPKNLRSIIGGSAGSILDVYRGDYIFDKYDITLTDKRGQDRGITIRHGKNMTDLEQEIDSNNIFTGIFPFYSKKYTETSTKSRLTFQQCYIVEGRTPLRHDWLSTRVLDSDQLSGAIAFKPFADITRVVVQGVDDLVEKWVPIQVDTEDESYYKKIYIFKRTDPIPAFISILDINIIQLSVNEDGSDDILPDSKSIYILQNVDPEYFEKKVIYDTNLAHYIFYDGDGFYEECIDASKATPPLPINFLLPLDPIRYDEVAEEWVVDSVDGLIHVFPVIPRTTTESIDKYSYTDVIGYPDHIVDPQNPMVFDGVSGVLYLNEDLKNKNTQRILTLDLTDDIDSIPNLKPEQVLMSHVFNKAEQYLKDNDFTKVKETIKISFIKLSDSIEYEHLKQLEIVQLGDEISVIYENLGVNSKHRVIRTEYNALSNSYNEIELGDKIAKITNNIISVGDKVSNLKNDQDYVNKSYVVNFVAENAEIINAAIQNAMIDTLNVSEATIDQLVANLMTADTAKIKKLLEAGSVRVKGDITLDSGSITINDMPYLEYIEVYVVPDSISMGSGWLSVTNGGSALDPTDEITYPGGTIFKVITGDQYYRWNKTLELYRSVSTYAFSVDRMGNVIANSLIITGGKISIGDNFNVSNDGILTAKGIKIIDGEISIRDKFVIDSSGNVEANAIQIKEVYAELIDTNEVITEDIVVNKLYFLNTKDIFLTRVKEDTTQYQSQTITRSATVNSQYREESFFGYIDFTPTVTVNFTLFYEKTFVVTCRYREEYSTYYYVDIDVTIPAGEISATAPTVSIPVNILYAYDQFGVQSTFPVSYTESITTGAETDKIVLQVGAQQHDLITGLVSGELLGDPIQISVDEPTNESLEYWGKLGTIE